MCLDKVNKRITDKSGTGYKAFLEVDGKLHSVCKGVPGKPYPEGVWLRELDYRQRRDHTKIWSSAGSWYPTGFHVYLSKEGADSWLDSIWSHGVRKVKFRNVVAQGREGKDRIVVAQEIFIVPKRKKVKKESKHV